MHDLGVADEFEGDEPQGGVDVVLGDLVVVARDSRDHQVVEAPDAGQCGADLLRPGQVEGESTGADPLGDEVGAMGVTAGQDGLVPTPGPHPGELQPDARRTAHDEDAAHDSRASLRYSQSRVNR
jgi:hypothetical protein